MAKFHYMKYEVESVPKYKFNNPCVKFDFTESVSQLIWSIYCKAQSHFQRISLRSQPNYLIKLPHGFNDTKSRFLKSLRAHLHETQSEAKPLWKVVPFTWHFHYGQPWDLKPLQKLLCLHDGFTAVTVETVVRF